MTKAIVISSNQAKLMDVESLAAKLGAAEAQLEHGYGKLAYMLKEVSEERCWEGSYESFGAFLNHLKEQHKVGRASLYSYLATAKALSGDVNEEQLSEMGISKALVLKAAKETNFSLPENAVEKALDPDVTVKDLKELLFAAQDGPKLDNSQWLDLNFSFYVTDDEKLVLESAANAARRIDPPIKEDLKQSAIAKEIALRWAQEFLGQYQDQVVEGGKSF